ncbi:DUF484 family protein [Oceanicoccus sp. KOV_DT_Chl]|uniref:DUF484 family protein n=1 Tax=Oceanicoccus sp. KOV_DT_Chl TaxID=1904639 RepID=UPI000C79E1C5|nr:DUF484 family protein [Oceanicoccus sp. KOV_DT_Chl]
MEPAKKNNNDKDISAEDVAKYLKANSGFFLKRDDLLLELKLAHPSGRAVSLLERQVSLLRERNMDMRNRLGGLLEHAGDNDLLFDRTRQLVLSLLEVQGLDSLVNTFTRSMLKDFKMDFATLTLFGKPENYRTVASRVVPLDDAYAKIPNLLKNDNPTCGALRPEDAEFLFLEQAHHVGSAAVLPLSFGTPLGVIAIGSRGANHFHQNMDTLFLGYIAEVLNRLLSRHLNY